MSEVGLGVENAVEFEMFLAVDNIGFRRVDGTRRERIGSVGLELGDMKDWVNTF
jgi:hypothetical protein